MCCCAATVHWLSLRLLLVIKQLGGVRGARCAADAHSHSQRHSPQRHPAAARRAAAAGPERYTALEEHPRLLPLQL